MRTRGVGRVFLGAATFLAACCGGLAFGSSPAWACTNQGFYWVGMYHTESLNGAHAWIDRYEPRLCQSSSAWSMVANSGNPNELAQIGWLKLSAWSTTTVYYFYEYGESGSLNPPVMLGAVPNPRSLAKDEFGLQYYVGIPSYWQLRINSVVQASPNLNWTPNNGEWMAEVHSNGDQVAGDLSNPVLFSTVQHYNGSAWVNDSPASTYGYNSTPYGSGSWSSSSNEFDTYDSRYNSEG